jgi:hypothetical protein
MLLRIQNLMLKYVYVKLRVMLYLAIFVSWAFVRFLVL